MADIVKIQIIYEEDVVFDKPGNKITFRDALYFTPQQYANMSKEDIDAIKANKINKWKQKIITAQTAVVNIEEKLNKEKENLIKNQVEIAERLSSVTAQINSIKNEQKVISGD